MSKTLDDLYDDEVLTDQGNDTDNHYDPFVDGPEDEEFSANLISSHDFDDIDNEPSVKDTDVVKALLLDKGIVDPHAINYEAEDGTIEKVDFYELPYEEQLEILKSSDKDIDYDLDDHEVNVINFLRENKVSFEDAVEFYKRQAVEEYIKQNDNIDFTVDTYSNEELFLLDLKAKYDTFTDEELQLELEKELAHPDLFNKKIDKIRAEYKDLEIRQKDAEELEVQAQENSKFEELKNNLIGVATITSEIGGIDIDIEEKNQILDYILLKDVNGNSSLIKDLDDPKTLFDIAWYATKGKEAFDFVHDYYRKEIEKVRKASFEKGKQQAVNGMPPTSVNRVNLDTRSRVNTGRKVQHMDDLYN